MTHPSPAGATYDGLRLSEPVAAEQFTTSYPDKSGNKEENPAGQRKTVRPRAERRAQAVTPTYAETRKWYERKVGLLKKELTAGKTYVRTVDLEELYGFSKPGVYKVQLTYARPFRAGEGRDHWTGGFGGQRVWVTIR